LRIAIGKRDIESGKVEVYRRDTGEKMMMTMEELLIRLPKLLYKIQNDLLSKNLKFREDNTYYVDSYEDFKEKIEK